MPVLRRLAAGLPGLETLVLYDTLPLARSLLDESAKLEHLAQRFGVSAGRSHHALDDASALAGVMRHLGVLKLARPVKADGRDGFLLVARGCGCHRETPLMLYLASTGKRVTWLMANGPQVTPDSTLQLAAHAP